MVTRLLLAITAALLVGACSTNNTVKQTASPTVPPPVATRAAIQTSTRPAATATRALATATKAPTVPPPVASAASAVAPVASAIASAAAPVASAAAPVLNAAEAAPCKPGQVKGNKSSHIYHTPSGRDYAKTKANVQCFDTEAEARAAGFRPAEQ